MIVRASLLIAAALLLSGCLRTAASIVTAPVRIVSSGVDAVTTSQSEADENRGRRLRQREEDLGRLSRRRDDAREDCEDGDRGACRDVEELTDRIEELRDAPI